MEFHSSICVDMYSFVIVNSFIFIRMSEQLWISFITAQTTYDSHCAAYVWRHTAQSTYDVTPFIRWTGWKPPTRKRYTVTSKYHSLLNCGLANISLLNCRILASVEFHSPEICVCERVVEGDLRAWRDNFTEDSFFSSRKSVCLPEIYT